MNILIDSKNDTNDKFLKMIVKHLENSGHKVTVSLKAKNDDGILKYICL